MKQYETVMIFTPVLSEGDLKRSIDKVKKLLKTGEADFIHEETWGMRQLAYPIQKKTTGHYYLIEFKSDPQFIARFELELSRDEHVLRFLTTRLDKYGIEYNDKKRKGLIGVKKDKEKTKETAEKLEA